MTYLVNLESQNYQIKNEYFDLTTLLSSAMKNSQTILSSKNVKLSFEIESKSYLDFI